MKFALKACLKLPFEIVVVFFDDTVTTFELALAAIVELSLSCDYDYVETKRCLSKKGRPCRTYVISIDNGD